MNNKKYLILLGIVIILATILLINSKQSVNVEQNSNKTREYQSSEGIVNIPVNPNRIYTDYYVGEVLALENENKTLVGADLTYSSPAWSDKIDNVVDTRQSIEMVASLKPDLIITIHKDLYEQYSSIAPTVYLEYGINNPIDTFKNIADIINEKDKAEDIINIFLSDIEKTKKEIDQPELTYSILELWDNQIYVYGNNYGRSGYIIYDLLNLSGTQTAEKTIIGVKESYKLISLESLNKYVGDVIILTDPQDNPYYEEIKKSPLWTELDAVKNNNVYIVDSDLFYFTDILSLEKQLEELDEIFKTEL